MNSDNLVPNNISHCFSILLSFCILKISPALAHLSILFIVSVHMQTFSFLCFYFFNLLRSINVFLIFKKSFHYLRIMMTLILIFFKSFQVLPWTFWSDFPPHLRINLFSLYVGWCRVLSLFLYSLWIMNFSISIYCLVHWLPKSPLSYINIRIIFLALCSVLFVCLPLHNTHCLNFQSFPSFVIC